MKEFKNILIVRTDRVGDVILTTPAIKALREAYPKAKISLLVSPSIRDLIDDCPYLDEVLVDDRRQKHKGPVGFARLVLSLRQRRFDLALIYHTKKRTNLMCFMAGIPCRMGYKNNKFGFLLTHPLFDERHLGLKHEAQYCLDVLRGLGIESGLFLKTPRDLAGDLYLTISSESQRWADAFWRDNRIAAGARVVVVHPGASDPSRRWPEARFAQLLEDLMRRWDCKIVIAGTADISATAAEIISQIKSGGSEILDLTGKTTLGQLAALLKRCDLLISNDSGPVHMAAAAGTPVVSIFTRNQPGINPERWHPLGLKSRVVGAPLSTGVSFRKAGRVDLESLQPVSTSQVLEAVDALFKLC